MKDLIRISAIVFLIACSILACPEKIIAQTDGYKIVSEKVANRDFVFVATSLSPMGGKLRILTSEYDVKVNKDSIISYLPYFGNAQQAPGTPEDAGVMFTSTKFDYVSEAAKKKSWNVDIKFKDQRNTQQFSFIIYDDGNALLNVTSNFRDPISYRGNIKL